MSINYLKNLNPCSLDDHISFDEGPHIYTIDGDSSFMSVTQWNHSHFPKFDADVVVDKMMKSRNWKNSPYHGMAKADIIAKWKNDGEEASRMGTKMHYDIECFYNKMPVKNDSVEYEFFKNFHRDHQNLLPYRTEWMVYDKELKFAGSIDMVFKDPDTNKLLIYDWKRCKKIKTDNRWQSATSECIRHLDDCNFNHYALQLNTYKYILEHNYDEEVVGMYLICLHPNNDNGNYIKLKVPELTGEIMSLMKVRYDSLY